MPTTTLDFFVVMFDLMGITVCGLTILYLVRMNLMERRASLQQPSDGGEGRTGNPGGLPRHSDPYQEVRQMAKMNMSPRDISERVKIPRGEVELIVKFARLDFAGQSRRA